MNDRATTQGSVLVGLLWCLTLLAVVVIGLLYRSRLDLRVSKNMGDTIQARYLALAGVEKAKALLYQDMLDRKRSRQNHSGQLYDAPQHFRDIEFGRGVFRVFHQAEAGPAGQLQYGVRDEEARLNVNLATGEELKLLPGLEPHLIPFLIDFRDEDQTPSPGGAEADYYLGLQPPYLPKNRPFETLRELLQVRGFTRELWLGEDLNANGVLDPEEDDGSLNDPPDNQDHQLDAGLSRYCTVHSAVANVNAAGDARVDVQQADEAALTAVNGISSSLAKALISYRNQNRLGSLDDLLDVVAVSSQPNTANQGQSTPTPGQPPSGTAPAPNRPPNRPPNSSANSGEKLISEDLLLQIADDITLDSESELAGAININTAEAAVLHCLPGVENELAHAIVSYRQSSGFFQNVAWLLRVPGMTRQIFKQVAPKVTVRSETFRILSEGKVASSGARQRIEAIVRLGASGVETLAYREDL